MLDDLSLRVAAGERVLLAGPSGSGKSTLLRALAGLLAASDSGELSGTVRVGGHDPQDQAGLAGLVLQDPGSGVVASSLARDVAFGLENLRVPRDAMAAPVAAALEAVRLRMAPDSPTSALSGGEQQRLALAGALAMSPRLLLLDEPTAMLDPSSAAVVRTVVGDVVAARALTTVVVEHRLGPWLDLVERLLVLDARGAVTADGPPGRVLAEHGETLAALGIWVPGLPDPEPLHVDLGFGPPAVPDGEPTLSARRVTVRHTARPLNLPARTTTAVAGLDLEVRAGRSLALVGPSGSGKSSLLAVLGGLLRPSAGDVAAHRALGPLPPGERSSPELARMLSWVPQRAGSTFLSRTVGEEVLATVRALGLDAPAAVLRVEGLLDRLGLAHLADADPRTLSGGEQRRLAVAAAVAHQPAVVLADEPTVGQDRLTWAVVVGVLAAVRAGGSAVVVATHDDGVRERADEERTLVAPAGCETGPEPERRRPLAARAGPLSLLGASLLVLPLPALLDSWRQSVAVLGVEALLGTVALAAPGAGPRPVGRWRGVLVRLGPAALAALGVGWSAWLLGGRDLAVASGAALRVLAIVVPSVVLLPFVSPEALGDHVAQRLHLPARPVVAATAALQRFQSFGRLWTELMLARRVRGVGAGRSAAARVREVAAVTFSMFVGTLGQAAQLAVAMDARGFGAARRRTWAGAAPWGLADSLVLIGGLLVVTAAALARLLLPR